MWDSSAGTIRAAPSSPPACCPEANLLPLREPGPALCHSSVVPSRPASRRAERLRIPRSVSPLLPSTCLSTFRLSHVTNLHYTYNGSADRLVNDQFHQPRE